MTPGALTVGSPGVKVGDNRVFISLGPFPMACQIRELSSGVDKKINTYYLNSVELLLAGFELSPLKKEPFANLDFSADSTIAAVLSTVLYRQRIFE